MGRLLVGLLLVQSTGLSLRMTLVTLQALLTLLHRMPNPVLTLGSSVGLPLKLITVPLL